MIISKLCFFSFIFFSSFFLEDLSARKMNVKNRYSKKNSNQKSKPLPQLQENGTIQLINDRIITLKKAEEFLVMTAPLEVQKYYSEIDRDDLDETNRPVDKRVIDGWFDKRLIPLLLIIDSVQAQHGIVGNVGEIGVWQGRSFIPIALLTKNNERAVAIDCFELYQFNFDNSGGFCNFEPFINNVKKYWSRLDHLKVLKGNSLDFTANDYMSGMGNGMAFRLFSIDGSHEALSTAHDMKNAYECLAPGGVIIIDDYFNHSWPGVSEGVNIFMNKNIGSLQPFLIAWNKIFFTHPEYAKKYAEQFKAFFNSQDLRLKKFFNTETPIYDGRD